MKQFSNLNELNFLSVMLISPAIKIGNIKHNQDLIISEIEKHTNNNLLVFSQLSLTGATYGDFFFNNEMPTLINEAISKILLASHQHHATLILGTPLLINGNLSNVALFISNGKIIGIVPRQNNCR